MIASRALGGTQALSPDGMRVDLVAGRCPHPHCAKMLFGVGDLTSDASTTLMDAEGLRVWLVKAALWDLLRVVPLLAFVALFAVGPVAAVHATFGFHESDGAPVFVGALLAVLPEAILLVAIVHGLTVDMRRTRESYDEVVRGAVGGLTLVPDPRGAYRVY